MYTWDKKAVSSGLLEIENLRDSALQELKNILNSYNQWNKSKEYYDIIAGDWLEHFIHLLWIAKEEGKGSKTNIINSNCIIPVTSDIRAYDQLRWQGISEFHENINRAVTYLIEKKPFSYWKFSAKSSKIEFGKKPSSAYKALKFLSTKKPEVLIVEPYFKCCRREVIVALTKWRKWAALDNLTYLHKLEVNLNEKWRLDRARAVGKADGFLDIVKILMPLHLPVVLLEGFARTRETILKLPIQRPKIIYSANALNGHVTFKILASEWRQKGTILLHHQHGGGYGIDRIHALEQFESRVADRFYSWGWKNTSNTKVQPLSPAPPRAQERRQNIILLNCVDYPAKAYRIHFQPMPGTINKLYLETFTFVKNLKNQSILLIRPYMHDYGTEFKKIMEKTCPGTKFDNFSKNNFVRFSESRLVVHNYLGTSYLETLALDIPTVCFFDPDTYAFREEAQPFLDNLERVGILHRSGRSAATFVNEYGNNPEKWWLQHETQKARKEFIHRYANFSPDWQRHWETEFRSVIAENC